MVYSRFLHAQDAEYDSLLAVYLKLDSIWIAEIERDSLDIFSLLDSMTYYQPKSQLTLRSSYSNQVYDAGRSYGIDQFGLSNAISYYHKTGISIDISGQYFSGLSPSYNATSIGLNYGRFISANFGYGVNASRTFYHELEEDASINNTLDYGLGFNTYHYSKYIQLGVDYTYSFGSSGTFAHRLVPSLTFTRKLKTSGFLKRIKISPALYITYGSESLYTEQYNNLVARNFIKKFGRDRFRRALQNKNEMLLNLLYSTDVTEYFGPLNM